MLTKQSQVTVKENNLRLVLATVIGHEPLSRADIVRHTRISKPAISSLIDDLLGRGIISEIGEGRSSGGRKPILLGFNSGLRHFLAFEMGRTGYRIAVSDLKGRFVGHREGIFRNIGGIDDRLAVLKQAVFDTMQETGIGKSDLLGIICVAPGIYAEKGKALKRTPGYREAGGQDLGDFFRSAFGREVVVHHSTRLALLGEKIAGKARGYEDVLYIDFAYGLGCALMIGGRIYSGSQGSAGGIGHFYSSLEEFRTSRVKPCRPGRLENRISSKAIFDACRQGDQEAEKILGEGFACFNMALCNVINLLAPELVILGGGFSRAGELLTGLVEREIHDRVLVMPRVEVSELKNQASLIGGIQYLIEHTDLLAEL